MVIVPPAYNRLRWGRSAYLGCPAVSRELAKADTRVPAGALGMPVGPPRLASLPSSTWEGERQGV